MALNKHWCAQGTINSTQVIYIYRHIIRCTRHTLNYTHIQLCSKHNLIDSSHGCSHGTAKLHNCALLAQWKTTHLCSHGTTLHTKSSISGRLIDDAAISGVNRCGLFNFVMVYSSSAFHELLRFH